MSRPAARLSMTRVMTAEGGFLAPRREIARSAASRPTTATAGTSPRKREPPKE